MQNSSNSRNYAQKPLTMDEIQERVALVLTKRRIREGKNVLSACELPVGNFYCRQCTCVGFVLPEKGKTLIIPDYCVDCEFLIQSGVFVV